MREVKLLRLEEAIRKMTSLPASRMRLRDRGLLRPGMAADIVAFDPDTVRERSTYADPNHYSQGFAYVAVNGELVIDGGKITDARPGRPLLLQMHEIVPYQEQVLIIVEQRRVAFAGAAVRLAAKR